MADRSAPRAHDRALEADRSLQPQTSEDDYSGRDGGTSNREAVQVAEQDDAGGERGPHEGAAPRRDADAETHPGAGAGPVPAEVRSPAPPPRAP